MATYKVDLPEGGFVQFQAADNASDDELQSLAQKRYVQHQTNLQKEIAKGREEYDPTKGMGGWEKAAANVGAGMSNLSTGVQGLATKAFGSEEDQKAMDADILEKRARDEHLAEKTTGGSALQLAGEIAPTLLIPAGALGSGAARAAGIVLPKALGARLATKGATTVLDAALAGGVSGGLAPTTSDESALLRAAGGAVLGGAVPFVGGKIANTLSRINPWGSGERLAAEQVAAKLGDFSKRTGGAGDVSETAAKIAKQIRELPSQAGEAVDDVARGGAGRAGADMGAGGFDPALAAAERTGATLDPAARPAGRIIDEGYGKGGRPAAQAADDAAATAQPGGITLSTAAQLQSPELAWLEVGSRARNASHWSRADQQYAEDLANSLRSATSEGADIGSRRATRNATWDANMAEAMQHADPRKFAGHVDALKSNIATALRSPEAANPKVKSLLRTMAADIEESGADFSPAHLQQMRANFNERMSPMNPTAYGAAPRDSKAVKSIIDELDNILEDTTGGHWSKVRQDYARDAASLDQAKSAQRLYEKYYDATGRPLGTGQGIAGDLPNLTEAGFSRTVARDAESYSPEALAQIQAMQDAIAKKNIVQRVKSSGTGGGGSATAPTMFAADDAAAFGKQVADVVRQVPGVGNTLMNVAQGARGIANYKADKALAGALQDPAKMLRLLERLEASGQPLSRSQRAMLQSLRDVSQAGALAGQR